MKNRKQDVKHSRMYDNPHIKGVNKPHMVYPGFLETYSQSAFGYQVRGIRGPGKHGPDAHWFCAIRIHCDTLAELMAQPKPKLKGI